MGTRQTPISQSRFLLEGPNYLDAKAVFPMRSAQRIEPALKSLDSSVSPLALTRSTSCRHYGSEETPLLALGLLDTPPREKPDSGALVSDKRPRDDT